MFKTILFYNFYQKKVENCLREKISDKYHITWSIVTREALSSLTKISPRNNSVMTWEKSVSPPLRLVKCCGVFIHSITAPQNIVCFQGSHLSYYLFLSIKSEHMFVMIFGASFWVVSSFSNDINMFLCFSQLGLHLHLHCPNPLIIDCVTL